LLGAKILKDYIKLAMSYYLNDEVNIRERKSEETNGKE
jgi:hypothetical protein